MAKVSFISNIYGTPKGHSYVVRDMVKALMSEGHEISMYRILNNPITDEFPKIEKLKSEYGQYISKEDFENWLDEVKPDYCVFMEYCQWWSEDHDKVEICKERGIKTIGFLVYEKLDWDKAEHYKLYTKIICPTGFQTKLMRKHGIINTSHIPWGVDFEEIDAVQEPMRRDDKIVFYHCGGSGGVDNRKNTDAVIAAYQKIKDENTDLYITHLNMKTFARKEILAFTKYADVVVNTAKWDTLGLNTLEANACGKPIIVCNTDPMTELVRPGVNGLLVDGDMTTSKFVTCPACNVDIDKLASAMMTCKNKLVLDTLKGNAKKFAEINFNWKENQKDFLSLFR